MVARYPNLKIIYVSSRSYAGYSTDENRAPEPSPYETGFAVKWLVEDAMNGLIPGPWVGWGPYLWTDGVHARSDGLTWQCADLQDDGLHPTASGTQKTTSLWLNLLHSDPTATPWYAKH